MIKSPVYRQIGVIGAGRVGRALALGLGANAEAPPLFYSRSPETLRAAIAQVGNAVASPLSALADNCDLIAIAVSDDAVGPVTEELARAMPGGCAPFIFHVSGRSGAVILDPLRSKRALTAAIHPVMTFTGDPEREVARMAGARFAITASSAEAMVHARAVVALLNGVAVEISEARRPLYHAALCHAANHLVTLLSGSARALEAAGVGEPYALLAPLVRAALENSLSHGFAALSGPLLRGDDATIASHLAALDRDCPEILPAYRAMALSTLDEIERSGSPAPAALYEALR